ncbi:MAG: hypothetical protein K0R51_2896 [Cytophagaceae bacterium]|jgi:hypothetical protein|nr:hypothetical protein [Cytophagaceae bacterium]
MMESREKKLLKSFNDSAEYIVYGFAIAVVAVPFFLVIRFAGTSFSSSVAEWGQVGDYIGGILNPLVSIASVFFLIYLTLVVKDRDDKSDTNHINTQKLLAINQLRFESVKEIAKVFNTVQLGGLKNQPTLDEIQNVQETFELFTSMNKYLFEEVFTNEFEQTYRRPLESSIRGIVNEVTNYKARNKVGPTSDAMTRFMNDYWNQQVAFVDELNKYLFKEMSPIY